MQLNNSSASIHKNELGLTFETIQDVGDYKQSFVAKNVDF